GQRNGGASAAGEGDQRRRTALLPRALVAGRRELRQHAHFRAGQLHLRGRVTFGCAPLDGIAARGESERKRFRRSGDLREQVLRAVQDEGRARVRRKTQRRLGAAQI